MPKSIISKLPLKSHILLYLPIACAIIISSFSFITFSKSVTNTSQQGVKGAKSEMLDLLYPNSYVVSEDSNSQGIFLAQKCNGSLNEIIDYYDINLQNLGWEKVEELSYRKSNKELYITVTKETDKTAIVNLEIRNEYEKS